MLSPEQIIMIKEQAYAGKPSELKGVCKIYPQKMGDIIEFGTLTYNGWLGVLLLTEIDIYNMIKEKTGEEVPIEEIQPLSYLLQSAQYDDTFFLELKRVFSTFVKEEVLLLPKNNSILVGDMADRRLITNQNYRDFQDILRIQNKRDFVEPPPANESPGQRKMRLLREKVAAVKKKQAQKKGDTQNLLDMLQMAEVYGIDIENHTLYAFYDLLRRHQMKEKWDQDIRMICAGADSKKIKTKYWGESFDEE